MPFDIPMPVFWLIALVVFGLIEGATAGLTSIWFAVGSLAALFTAMAGGSPLVQIILFLVLSFLTLLIVRPLARKWLIPRREATNADRVIGAEGIVSQAIDNVKGEGQVNIAGQIWTARAEEDCAIPAGTMVRILRIEGVKVYVIPAAVFQPAAQSK